jgi:hypothetical protein
MGFTKESLGFTNQKQVRKEPSGRFRRFLTKLVGR